MQKPNLNGLNGNGYQPLSVPPVCYQCGLYPGMLSERSRCAECERERADFNAKENDQLREAAGVAKDQAEALREALDVANQEIKRLESAPKILRGSLIVEQHYHSPLASGESTGRHLFDVLARSGLASTPEESVRVYATRVVEKLAEVTAQADAARRDAWKWQEIAAAGEAEKEKEFAEKVERLSAATAERDQLRHAFLSLAGYFDEIKVRVPGVGDE